MRRITYIALVFASLLSTSLPLAAAAATLNAAVVTGSKRFSVAELSAAAGPYIGQPVSRELIDRISEAIEEMYRSGGYVQPQIAINDAQVLSSTPHLQIYDAQIAEVAISGDAGPHLAKIQAQTRMLQSEVIHKQRSAQILRRIAELPGLSIRATFEPRAGEPNRFTLVLNVAYDPMRGSLSFHNRGTHDLGRTVVGGSITLNGLLGVEEIISLAAASSIDHYNYLGGRIERRFGLVGTKLDVGTSRGEPSTDWRYSIQRARVEVNVMTFESDIWRIEPLVAFAARNSKDEDSEDKVWAMTHTRSFEIGVAARHVSARSTTHIRSSYEQGIDGLGAEVFSRYGTSSDLAFGKAAFEASHLYAINPAWRTRLGMDAQWTSDDLPSGERFMFGGARFGKAFDPAALVGDKGVAASFQLERLQRWQHPFIHQGRLYGQTDFAYVREGAGRNDHAASVSAGMSANIASFFMSVEISQSLADPESGSNSGPRAFVAMQRNF